MAIIKRAMVLAAGKGTRLGELTRETPKPLIDLGGTTPLFRILKELEKLGVEKVVINAHWCATKIFDFVKKHVEEKTFPFEIVVSYEEELLETGGGIKKAIHEFEGEPFLITNGDIVWENGFEGFAKELAGFYKDNMTFLLGLTPNQYSPKKGGDVELGEDSRIRFLNEGETSDESYCGLSIIHPRAFDTMEFGFKGLKLLWEEAVAAGDLYGFKKDCSWIDMGTPEGLEKAKSVIKKEQAAKVLKFGA